MDGGGDAYLGAAASCPVHKRLTEVHDSAVIPGIVCLICPG